MLSRVSRSRVMISSGLILLLAVVLIGSAKIGPAPALAGVTPTEESPVDTPTPVPPTDTPLPPTDTPIPPTNTPVRPTYTPAWPTRTPWVPTYPTPTPVPITEVFIPAPTAGGRPALQVPIILWEAGLGFVLIGLGLAWWRRR